jgi:hypothetical protein
MTDVDENAEASDGIAGFDLDELFDLLAQETSVVKVLADEWPTIGESLRPGWLSAVQPSLREIRRIGAEIEKRYREMPIGVEVEEDVGRT